MKARIFLLFVLLLGCRSVKKDSSKVENSLSIDSIILSNKTLYEKKYSVINRSASKSVNEVILGTVKIFPRGEFSINTYGDFTGNADSVLQTTTRLVDTHQKESDSSSFTAEKNAVESTQASTIVESKTEESHKAIQRTPSLIPYIGIGLILIGLIAFIMWRLKIL